MENKKNIKKKVEGKKIDYMIRFKDSKSNLSYDTKKDNLNICIVRNKIIHEVKVYDDLILNFDKNNKIVLIEILKASNKFKECKKKC